MGGNLDEAVAKGKVVAGKAAFFGSEDEGGATAADELGLHDGCEGREENYRLLGLAMGECGSAEDEGAIGNGVGEALRDARVSEQSLRSHGRSGFAPVGFVRSDDGELREAEVGHGAGGRPYIERVARGDEDDVETIALFSCEQGAIVRREPVFRSVDTLSEQTNEPRRRRHVA